MMIKARRKRARKFALLVGPPAATERGARTSRRASAPLIFARGSSSRCV